MEFGNRLRFCIELELDEKYEGVWLFGKFCYWIKNKQIGDYVVVTSLRDVLFSIGTQILCDEGKRFHQELFDLPSAELFKRLDDTLYGEHCDFSEYEKQAESESWARFNIGIPMNIFGEWKIFLIEKNKKARIIYKNDALKNGNVCETFLDCGEFDGILKEVYQHLELLYNKEIENA